DAVRWHGSHYQTGDQRQESQSGAHGVCSLNALEELRHGKQYADHGEGCYGSEDHAPGEGGRAEEREVDQWLATRAQAEPALPEEETNQHQQARDYREQGTDIGPTIAACLDEAIGHADQAGGRGDDSDRVQ